MSYYQPNAPPKLWTQMSRKKKAKYMDAMKLLYGGNDAKEDSGKGNSYTHGKTGTSKIMHVAKKK